MLYPVLVNVSILDEQGKENIAAAVLDLHASKIERLFHTVDGNTSLLTSDNIYFKILVPFPTMYEIYNKQHLIDITFQEEVLDFFKDNYKAIRDRKNRRDGEAN